VRERFRVQSFGSRDYGSRVQGIGTRDQGIEIRTHGAECRV